MKKKISIVIPVLNEEKNIQPLLERVIQVFNIIKEKYNYELIFTDNRSVDNTWNEICEACKKYKNIKGYRFSKNFGYQKSIYTGYIKSTGDAVIQLDCDLQDPPELIPLFLEKWENGYDVVYGIRDKRAENRFITNLRKIFYRILNLLSEDEVPVDAGDFRLVDKKIIKILETIKDANPYLRGTIAAIGFNQIGINYDRSERLSGQSKFKLSQVITLACDGILNHSIIPLRLSSLCGLIIAIITTCGVFIYTICKLFLGFKWPEGFTTITILILFGISINSIFLGIIGEYLGRIFTQVKLNKITIIEEEVSSCSM